MRAPLMATQWGAECWCAEEADVEIEYDRHGVEGATCDYQCPGNPVRSALCHHLRDR